MDEWRPMMWWPEWTNISKPSDYEEFYECYMNKGIGAWSRRFLEIRDIRRDSMQETPSMTGGGMQE